MKIKKIFLIILFSTIMSFLFILLILSIAMLIDGVTGELMGFKETECYDRYGN